MECLGLDIRCTTWWQRITSQFSLSDALSVSAPSSGPRAAESCMCWESGLQGSVSVSLEGRLPWLSLAWVGEERCGQDLGRVPPLDVPSPHFLQVWCSAVMSGVPAVTEDHETVLWMKVIPKKAEGRVERILGDRGLSRVSLTFQLSFLVEIILSTSSHFKSRHRHPNW